MQTISFDYITYIHSRRADDIVSALIRRAASSHQINTLALGVLLHMTSRSPNSSDTYIHLYIHIHVYVFTYIRIHCDRRSDLYFVFCKVLWFSPYSAISQFDNSFRKNRYQDVHVFATAAICHNQLPRGV